MLVVCAISTRPMPTARARSPASTSPWRRGEILAIVGGSGCGKTTLLRLVAGLDQASGGSHRGRRRRDHVAASRRRHRLPGAAPAALAHRGRQRRLRHRRPAARRARRARRRGAGAGRTLRACRALAARTLRRPAAARRHRAGLRHAAQGAAAGRALLGARRLHPRQPARAPAGAVGGEPADHRHGHARRGGGGHAGRPRGGDAAAPRPRLRDHHACGAARPRDRFASGFEQAPSGASSDALDRSLKSPNAPTRKDAAEGDSLWW